jgi:hypothetical protein
MKANPRSLLREVVTLGLEVFVASYGSTAGAALSLNLLYPLAQAVNANLSFHQFNEIFSARLRNGHHEGHHSRIFAFSG